MLDVMGAESRLISSVLRAMPRGDGFARDAG